MSTNLNYFKIYADLEKENSDLFNDVNGYNSSNSIDKSLIDEIKASKELILEDQLKLNYELYEKEKNIKSEKPLSYDDFINKEVESYEDFKERFGLSEYKIKELHRMIHYSLEDKYKGINKNYNKNVLKNIIEESNKSIYDSFYKNSENKNKQALFGKQLSTLSNIVYNLSTSFNRNNLFAFGNANTGLTLASMIGQCNKEIVPMKFDKVPDSLISSDLKEMTKRDLNAQTNYYKAEEIKRENLKLDKENYEIKPYEESFNKEQKELTDKTKIEFRKTIMSYIVVNLPEPQYRLLYKDNSTLEFLKEIADSRIRNARLNLNESPSFEEPDNTNKKDNDWTPK